MGLSKNDVLQEIRRLKLIFNKKKFHFKVIPSTLIDFRFVWFNLLVKQKENFIYPIELCIVFIQFYFLFIILNDLDEFCEEYPHNLIPTPGYWIECSRQKIAQLNQHTIWDDSESDHDDPRPCSSGIGGDGERNCNDLYEDDEDSDHVPRWFIEIFLAFNAFL